MLDIKLNLDVLQKLVAYDDSDRLVYEGYAAPGTGADEAGWIIKKHFWHSTEEEKYLGCSWAGGKDWRLPKVWDDRADYTYTPEPVEE